MALPSICTALREGGIFWIYGLCKLSSEPEFLNFLGAQKSIPRIDSASLCIWCPWKCFFHFRRNTEFFEKHTEFRGIFIVDFSRNSAEFRGIPNVFAYGIPQVTKCPDSRFQIPFLYCMFLLCVYRYVYLYSLPHRIKRVPGFLSICLNWAPHPQASVAPPPFGSKRGDTLACGGGGGGTQFHRRDRHSGTLCIL